MFFSLIVCLFKVLRFYPGMGMKLRLIFHPFSKFGEKKALKVSD